MKNFKHYLWALVIVVAVILVILAAGRWGKNQPASTGREDQGQPVAPSPDDIKFKPLESSKLPQGLPQDLPLEKNVQVLQNFEAKDPQTGKTQATRSYVSSKSLAESFAAYQKYLTDQGWTVTSSLDQETVKNLSATKSGARLEILISSATGKNTVNVTYVY